MTSPSSAPTAAEIRALLLDSGAVRFGSFTLTSGAHSDVYVDVKKVWTDPDRLRTIARALAAHVGGADRLAGMELGAVPLVVAVALLTSKPYSIVRKAAKTHGTRNRIEGEIPPGARVAVLEDVSTTGGSVVETVNVLREAGAVVDQVVLVVDRESGTREALEHVGVRLVALATLAELRGTPS